MIRSTYVPARSDLFVRESCPQTLAAWKPYYDCVGANFEFQNSDIGIEFPEWRKKWIFAVVMLRTIGHVLKNVDSKKSNKIKLIIDENWNRWAKNKKDNWIFWEFILKERNNILKSYQIGISEHEDFIWHNEIEMDGIHIIREATYWWRAQLELIEQQLSL